MFQHQLIDQSTGSQPVPFQPGGGRAFLTTSLEDTGEEEET